jgi:hypothetical protein
MEKKSCFAEGLAARVENPKDKMAKQDRQAAINLGCIVKIRLFL